MTFLNEYENPAYNLGLHQRKVLAIWTTEILKNLTVWNKASSLPRFNLLFDLQYVTCQILTLPLLNVDNNNTFHKVVEGIKVHLKPLVSGSYVVGI